MTFMRSALAMDPADRVSSREAVCHPLFEGLFEDYASRHPHLQQPGDDVGGGVSGGGGLQLGNANGGGSVMAGGGGGGGARYVKNDSSFVVRATPGRQVLKRVSSKHTDLRLHIFILRGVGLNTRSVAGFHGRRLGSTMSCWWRFGTSSSRRSLRLHRGLYAPSQALRTRRLTTLGGAKFQLCKRDRRRVGERKG